MKQNSVPREFRSKLRWIPHAPYHIHAVRRALDVLLRLCRIFEFKGDERVKVRREDYGEAGCKVYQPVDPTSDAAMLYIHGGGYILLEAYLDDKVCRRMADKLGITIVSTEYRHAPKHPFPAPLDDCWGSWHWLQEHAEELGVDPRRAVIAGESAGGGLTAALAQRLQTRVGHNRSRS